MGGFRTEPMPCPQPLTTATRAFILRHMEVAVSDEANLANRAAVKKAARIDDLRRLAEGVPPDEIQEENSVAPVGFFEGAEISNLSEAIGR